MTPSRRCRTSGRSVPGTAFGGIVASVTYTGIRSRNLFTFIRGNRRADGSCCQPVPGYSNILISDAEGRKAWYDGLYVQLDRPYGVGGASTVTASPTRSAQPSRTGGDLFSLDFPTVADYPRYPTGGDERHRLVLTGIVRLPCDFLASTFITLGIGPALYHRRSIARRRSERAAVPAQRGPPGAVHLHRPRRVGLPLRRFPGGKNVPVPEHAPDLGDFPGLQHLQLRQFLGLSTGSFRRCRR